MKLAVVVQRYGAQINGGAELHARYIVELLARQHTVDVLTTCARDYVTWRDEWPEGTETVRGVSVRRFKVSREREPEEFGRRSTQVFEHQHSLADELAWLDAEGPTSPALVEYVRAHANDYDYIFFFSYRYYHAYHGVRAVPGKAILVPTAERDATIGLSMFGPIFRGARAIMYNSPEERAMIQAATQNTATPGVVVGVGSEVPRNPIAARFRRKFNIHDPFIIYVGRIDENKGCRELFTFFTSYRPRLGQRLHLVLIGNSILPIPDHPNVHHLGFVSDQDKFDAMAAADALIMPSYYESLSMVALEAWALGRPVLANGRCDVLRGQCVRSRAGLYYETFEEFAETLFTLTSNRSLAEGLGENGRQFFEQHYAWPVVERKYLDMLNHLAQEDAAGRQATPIERLPGWLTRRRKVLPPASHVLQSLPRGTGGNGGDLLAMTSASFSSVSARPATAAPDSSSSGLAARSADRPSSGSESAAWPASSSAASVPAGGGTSARPDGRRHSREGRDQRRERGRDGRRDRDQRREEGREAKGESSGGDTPREGRERRRERQGERQRRPDEQGQGQSGRPSGDRERDGNKAASGGGTGSGSGRPPRRDGGRSRRPRDGRSGSRGGR